MSIDVLTHQYDNDIPDKKLRLPANLRSNAVVRIIERGVFGSFCGELLPNVDLLL